MKALEILKQLVYNKKTIKSNDTCTSTLAFDRAMSLTGEIVDKAKLLQLELAQLEQIGIKKKCN